MSKVRIRVLWEDNGVTEQARQDAKAAAKNIADQLPDGYVSYGGTERYDGPATDLTDRVGFADTVEGYIHDNYDPDEVDDVLFCFLTEGNPFEYLEDALADFSVAKLMGAGYTTRNVGIPEGDDDYEYGLSVVNTYVSTFVEAVPVPYDPGKAVSITCHHELGHAMLDNVDAPTEHYLGAETYVDDGDHAVVTPMTYWYDHQLHTWANNSLEVSADCDVQPSDLTESTTTYSERTHDGIVEDLDYWF